MYFFKREDKTKNRPGYSFIEVIMAVFVVTSGLITAVALISKSSSQSLDSRDQQIAELLAQEGTELIKNIRDNNWLNNIKPGFKYLPSATSDNCRIDKYYNYGVSNDIKCDSDFRLYLDGFGYYANKNFAGTTRPTKFYRKISIDVSTDAATSTKVDTVTSVVIWGGSSFPTSPISTNNCNALNKCTFSQIILMDWGG